MATAKILARSWDLLVTGGAAIYVPTACTALTTTATALSGDISTSFVVASASGISVGQGLVLDGPLATPAAPTINHTAASTGLGSGVVQVQVALVNQYGTTIASAAASMTISAGDNIQVTSPPATQNATDYYAYVTQPGGSTFYQQETPGAPTNIGTNLTLTSVATTNGSTPPTTNTTEGTNPENVRVKSVVGTTITTVSPVAFSHTGTINVTGGPCAPAYVAPTSNPPAAGAAQSILTRIQGETVGNGHSIMLYLIPSGLLLTDAAADMEQFSNTSTGANQYYAYNPVTYLDPGDMLCWVSSNNDVSCELMGLEFVGAASTTTQAST